VAKSKLTFEVQARISVALALLGGLAALSAITLLVLKFKADTRMVVYNARGPFMLLFGAALLAALLAGGVGLLIGLNSAGQKRNTRSQLSWTGFFVSAAVITLSLCAGLFFYFTRSPMSFH
jgi:hypothetical protein